MVGSLIEDILFPVDFSPSCAAMAADVKRAAGLFGARVTLVHVFDLTGHNGFELYVRLLSEIAEEHRSSPAKNSLRSSGLSFGR